MKPIWWIVFFLVQAAFVFAGLVIVFWTINSWYEDRKLDAIFGAWLGSFGFFLMWKMLRKWVLDHMAIWRPKTDK